MRPVLEQGTTLSRSWPGLSAPRQQSRPSHSSFVQFRTKAEGSPRGGLQLIARGESLPVSASAQTAYRRRNKFNLGYLPVYKPHIGGRADARLQRPGECHWEAQARSVVMTIWGRRSTGYPRCACPRAISGLVPGATPFCWRRPTYTATIYTTLPASFWGRSRSSSSISIPGTLPTRLWLLAAFWGWVKKWL